MGLLLILRYGFRIVHARSYVPAVMALVIKRLTGVRFLFDMRGFWADERVDGGLWRREGRMFRVAKWFERRFLLAADHVVSLTVAAVREIERFPYLGDAMPPVTVIPTCADLSRFRIQAKPESDRDLSSAMSVQLEPGTSSMRWWPVSCLVEAAPACPAADHEPRRARLYQRALGRRRGAVQTRWNRATSMPRCRARWRVWMPGYSSSSRCSRSKLRHRPSSANFWVVAFRVWATGEWETWRRCWKVKGLV